mmetsp:Transcript_66897/g.145894  ORF Transcript_66897/g.145894 Transcript_66897/m.145894 type:complete len:546 (+) Transcript_66897:23-1660(+)
MNRSLPLIFFLLWRWLEAAFAQSSFDSCEANNQACRRGTFDYALEQFYKKREGTADSWVERLESGMEMDVKGSTRLGESELLRLGAHIIGDAGAAQGDIFFATFDFDGTLVRYDPLKEEIVEELPLGTKGGHYFSAVASYNSSHLLLGTAALPGRLLTVQTSPMQHVSTLDLAAELGGVVALAVDGSSVIAILGRSPAHMMLLSATPSGQLTPMSTLLLSEDAEVASPASPHFLDRPRKLAYVATRAGCIHRISYGSGSLIRDDWGEICNSQVKVFFGMAVDSRSELAVVVGTMPYRQLLTVDLKSGAILGSLPLSMDVSYITNIFVVDPETPEGSAHAVIVAQSRKDIPTLLQLDLKRSDSASSWGLVAGGLCDEYSWTEGSRILYEGDSDIEVKVFPTRHYGCVWIPRGRQATGAVLDGRRLYVATERLRCTVCTIEETFFGTSTKFCIEEHEDYRAPAAVCGQEEHNTRQMVWERALSNEQLQHATNQLYGAVNASIISFMIGEIPSPGQIYATKLPSRAPRAIPGLLLGLGLVAIALRSGA